MIVALIALLTLLMLGGSAGSWVGDIDKPLKDQVADKERREAVLDAVESLGDGMEEIEKSLQTHFEELLDAHIYFESDAAGFDAISEKLKADQAKAFALDLKTRAAMKENMTMKEWNAVFAEDQE